jgi:large subunit ribosomal protein L25
MAETITLIAHPRDNFGKGPARALRRAGLIPAIVYGHGTETRSLQLEQADLERVLQQIGTGSAIIDLTVDETPVRVLIREIQRHPTRKSVNHVDFIEVHAGEKLTLDVQLELEGSPEGVRNAGGVLEQFLREVTIEVLPRHIPEHVQVDVTDVRVGQSVHVADLSIPNAKILTDPGATICTVVPPRVEEEPVVAPEEEEEVEGALEPEVIRKPRAEDEAEGGTDEE